MARPRTPRGRARLAMARLAEEYPGTAAELCDLTYRNPFELLVATILSAQSTDRTVNAVTPAVFASWPGPQQLAGADLGRLEEVIHASGFFRAKARSLVGMAGALVERYDAEVPTAIEDLVTLPGVGRKTANVVRSVALGLPGLPVDTHVLRISRLLGLTAQVDPVKVEHELNAMIPGAARGRFSLQVIRHGRRVCVARRPACGVCVLADFCPSVGLGAVAAAGRAPTRPARNPPPPGRPVVAPRRRGTVI